MSIPGLSHQAPGVRDATETYESVVQWGDPLFTNFYKMGAVIDGASRDLGNTGSTHILRPGLAMAYNTTIKKWVPYDSGNGSHQIDICQGFLYESINMTINGDDVDRMRGFIVWGGPVKASAILLNEGVAGPLIGHGNENQVRAALAERFLLDDFYQK